MRVAVVGVFVAPTREVDLEALTTLVAATRDEPVLTEGVRTGGDALLATTFAFACARATGVLAT